MGSLFNYNLPFRSIDTPYLVAFGHYLNGRGRTGDPYIGCLAGLAARLKAQLVNSAAVGNRGAFERILDPYGGQFAVGCQCKSEILLGHKRQFKIPYLLECKDFRIPVEGVLGRQNVFETGYFYIEALGGADSQRAFGQSHLNVVGHLDGGLLSRCRLSGRGAGLYCFARLAANVR